MSWSQKTKSNTVESVASTIAKEYDTVRDMSLPIFQKEADQHAAHALQPVDFQPVRSPGIYEAEFGVKYDDLIFHFWPWHYHQETNAGRTAPRFKKGFEEAVAAVMSKEFGANRFEIKLDEDVGAIFVKCFGFGVTQFHREMAIKACENIHLAMGGVQG
jgi:hypothetical protein